MQKHLRKEKAVAAKMPKASIAPKAGKAPKASKASHHAMDLRTTLDWLRQQGDLIETDKEVDPDLEVTGLQKHLDGGCPVCSTTSRASPTTASSPTCSAT